MNFEKALDLEKAKKPKKKRKKVKKSIDNNKDVCYNIIDGRQLLPFKFRRKLPTKKSTEKE